MKEHPINHNYMKELMKMRASGRLNSLATDVTVSHDDWCMVFSGGRCNCEPVIVEGKPKPNRAQRRRKK